MTDTSDTAPHVLTEEARARLQAASHAVNAMTDAARAMVEAIAVDAAWGGAETDALDALGAILDAARARGRELNNALDSTSFPD